MRSATSAAFVRFAAPAWEDTQLLRNEAAWHSPEQQGGGSGKFSRGPVRRFPFAGHGIRIFRKPAAHGAPGGIRTPDLRIRNPPLYPAELRGRQVNIARRPSGRQPPRGRAASAPVAFLHAVRPRIRAERWLQSRFEPARERREGPAAMLFGIDAAEPAGLAPGAVEGCRASLLTI